MSLIRKIEGGLLTAYVMRDAISCPDFVCRVCQDAALVRYWRRQCRAVMLLGVSDISLNSTTFPDGWWGLLFVHLFSFRSWTYLCQRPVWLANTVACMCWACRRTTGVCLLTHAWHAAGANDMNGKMVILYCVHLERGLFCLLFDTMGWRGRRVDVCEIHHTAASLAQWSVAPLLHQQPSYTFLSPLLRAVHVGLLFTALSNDPHQ